MKQYWLFKTEPDTFSIEDLRNVGASGEGWDGVRNYQARNFLRDEVKINQEVFIYHSSCATPGIAGTARVIRAGYPDPSQFNPDSPYFDPKSTPDKPRWYCVDVVFTAQFPELIPLRTLKQVPELAEMVLVQKGSRLSIQPVTSAQWRAINKLARG